MLGAIAASGSTVYAPVRNGVVAALELNSGRVLWRQTISPNAAVLASPAISDVLVYAVANDGTLAILDSISGKLLEKYSVNAPEAPGVEGLSVSSPIIQNGRLYVGSETGGLRCFGGSKETNP